MTRSRAAKAFLGGVTLFVVLGVLGELTLRAVAAQVRSWSDAEVPLSGWREVFTNVGLFFARYFIFMLPLLLAACLVVAFLVARGGRDHARA